MLLNFVGKNPSNETCWRAIILQGKNTASYKFALARVLIDTQGSDTCIKISDLAEPFSRHVTSHLLLNSKQSTAKNDGKFIRACKDFNKNIITKEQLIEITKKEGFKYVLDAFHNISRGEVPSRFFHADKQSVTLTDSFYGLINGAQFKNLSNEVEARWRLWETAISLNISTNNLVVSNDLQDNNLFVQIDKRRRVDVTSTRDALNGYQKGKCFYCNRDITVLQGLDNSCDVDHFFPWSSDLPNVDGIWNLVLSCKNCNRWDKSNSVPNLKLVEKLYNRNNFYIESHHPLRETIIRQTGSSETDRKNFLNKYYNDALEKIPVIYNPTIVEESLL